MIPRTLVAAAALAVAIGAGCGDGAPATAQEPLRSPAPAPPAPRDSRLRDDLGGWEPAAELIEEASSLGDPERKAAALAALDAGPLAHKIDVLRAGLRLRDEVAARTCAARLTWEWIDNWECARCVDLLKADVLRPGSEASFDEFRSYLGTVDLPAFVDALPPLPWNYDKVEMVGHLHRLLHEDSIDVVAKLAGHPDAEIADTAVAIWWQTIADRSDRRREDALFLGVRDGKRPAHAPMPGLSSALVDELRSSYLADLSLGGPDAPPVKQETGIDNWTRRWCFDSTPGPQDEELLIEIADRCGTYSVWAAGGVATVLLGRLRGQASDEFLAADVVDDETSHAWMALAMRGAPGAVDHLAEWSAGEESDGHLVLAALMAADPVRARAVIEERVLGGDEDLALRTLSDLVECVAPGWSSEALAFDYRQMSWEGFEAKARAAPMSALRRAMVGFAVPGCRTRALAEMACRELDASFLTPELPDDVYVAFLETAAPESFRIALRRVAASDDEDARAAALGLLLEIGDPPSGAQLLELTENDPFGGVAELLGRSPSPEVLAFLQERVREREHKPPIEGLAVALGAPEGLDWPSEDVPSLVREELLAGRWREAFHAVLAAAPDEEHGDVGILRDDPQVRSYLERLRTRRDLGHYWYATGQLAAMGDAAARAEFWGAMTDGRYRITDKVAGFAKTLGGDLPATMPFWLEQLRSNCCRVSTSPWERLFGVETFTVPWRTPYDSAKDIWEAGTGPGGAGFVWSRICDRYVLAAR